MKRYSLVPFTALVLVSASAGAAIASANMTPIAVVAGDKTSIVKAQYRDHHQHCHTYCWHDHHGHHQCRQVCD